MTLATEVDPDLTAHERNIDLNQLHRAKEEVKTGISGNAWRSEEPKEKSSRKNERI